jgi:hypothetical protein
MLLNKLTSKKDISKNKTFSYKLKYIWVVGSLTRVAFGLLIEMNFGGKKMFSLAN